MQGIFSNFILNFTLQGNNFASTKYLQMQYFLLSFCLAATLGATEARNPSEMGDPPTIIIIEDNDDLENPTRGPVVVPINGYVDSTAEVVVLNFTQLCGIVHIDFSNLSDGSYYSTAVNGSGTVVIPLALTSGAWTVTFTLQSGVAYVGEFTI